MFERYLSTSSAKPFLASLNFLSRVLISIISSPLLLVGVNPQGVLVVLERINACYIISFAFVFNFHCRLNIIAPINFKYHFHFSLHLCSRKEFPPASMAHIGPNVFGSVKRPPYLYWLVPFVALCGVV